MLSVASLRRNHMSLNHGCSLQIVLFLLFDRITETDVKVLTVDRGTKWFLKER